MRLLRASSTAFGRGPGALGESGRRRSTKPVLLALAVCAALALVLSGCARHHWLEVRPGTYARIQGNNEAGHTAARALQSLTVDREANTVTLAFDAGPATTLPFVTRERDQWPSGCPTNLFHHYLEVLDLDANTVTIGDLVLRSPILVRCCPREPEQVILREEGLIGGVGDAVGEPYLVFTR